MKLREYQRSALDAITDEIDDGRRSVLVVMPTGTGKTVLFAHAIRRMQERGPGRAMVLAHREELIFQAATKIESVTGEKPDIEMAEYRADLFAFRRAGVVVSSIQTQVAGCGGDGRMTRFDPSEFGLLIIDEAHHAVADTYQRVIEYYRRNPSLVVLGVTATPDRADETALGKVFESVAFDYEIPDAIDDGWLVPIEARPVNVTAIDLSGVSTVAGDFAPGELARVLEMERPLHGMVNPLVDLAGDRRVLMFAASVAHAEKLCEILNRRTLNKARWVCGQTPKDDRRRILSEFAGGDAQYVVNVGVLTEGFDDPGVEIVAMGRPTKSRCLYAQMAGRGTRPLPGVVDGVESASDRRAAIAASAKPHLTIVDYVGNCGRHKLVTSVDVLGVHHADDVVDLARGLVSEASARGESIDVQSALDRAVTLGQERRSRAMEEARLAQEREARCRDDAVARMHKLREEMDSRRAAERARLAGIGATVKYTVAKVDPFDVFGVEPHRQRGWEKHHPASQKQADLLAKWGIDATKMSRTEARRLIGVCITRSQKGLCTFKQAKTLARYGYDARDMKFGEASKAIDRLARNGWKKPVEVNA